MSEQTRHLVDLLRQRLQATTRRMTLADLLFGLVLTLGIGAALWLGAVALEAGLWLDTTPRTVLTGSVAALVLGLVLVYLGRPLLRLLGVLAPPSEEDVAHRIGDHYPEVSDRLVNLLQLVDGRGSQAPTPLVDGAVRMLGEPIQTVDFARVETFARARRGARLASLPLVGVLVFLLAAPDTFWTASQRLLAPSTHFQRPAPFGLTVEPGDTELVRGQALDVVVRAAGQQLPRTIALELNNVGEEHVETITLTADSTGAFRHRLDNVRSSLRYRAQAEPVRTAWYAAEVTERPLVRGLQLGLAFPNYTQIPPQRLAPNVGDVTALPGTRVRVEVGVGGRAVEEAALQFDDGTIVPLTVDGDTAEGQFTLRRAGTYHVVLRNADGLANSDPIVYTTQTLTDAYPSITLLAPEPQTELDDALRTRLHVRMTDDFGFSQLRLAYRLAESRFAEPAATFSTVPLPLADPRQLDQEVIHDWLLAAETNLDPVPGDVIEYYVQVWDNDAVAGYKAARTETYRLRMPSLTERYEQLEQEQDTAEESIEEMLRESEAVREEFQELRDELRQKQQGDWEDARQLERIQQRQQQLESRADELARQMESISSQMEDNNLVSPETLQMYEELQRVAEEINSPELQEALKQLQEAMQDLNLQQMQEAIQNYEFNEEQYRQRLERTLDLFKRMRVQQQLDEAARRAEELARRQEQLAEQTEKLDEQAGEQNGEEPSDAESDEQGGEQQDGNEQDGNEQDGEQQDGSENGEQQDGSQQEGDQQGQQQDGDQQQGSESEQAERLAQEQERSAEEMEQLEEQLRELMEQMEALRNAPTEEMQQLQQQTEQQQMPEQMQDNAQKLRSGQKQQAQEQQQQMQQQLQQMQQQLQQMMQGMAGQQQQINMAGLSRALSDVLTLSQQQETLRQDLTLSPSDTPRLRDFAQQQIELSEGLTVVSDTLQRLASDIPQMTRAVQKETGDALRAMSGATEALAERSSRLAGGEQKTSMMHLNELALLLSDLMEQMQNQQSQGAGGMSMQQMMQQLQQMSGQQQQLNQQIQQMLNDVQGNRLSQDQQQRLRQMAEQQDMLRRQLKELSRNRELNDKAMGDLEKIAEEMEEAIRDLQRGDLDRPFVRRQQQILTRLLNASKSLRERGKENRREGQEGEDILRESPSDLPPAEQAEQLRRALLKALESGYAPDYEELIKRYFELLQERQQTP